MRTVLVHGFTQTARSWEPVIRCMTDPSGVAAHDVPDGLDFTATAHAIGDAGRKAVYVGYSMGGRLCLRLALDRPDLVEGLVLVSASPGIEDPAERAARREADERLARDIERDGVDAFLAHWLAQPMFSMLSPEAAGLDDRRAANSVERLTHQLRALGQGAQEPLWDRLHELCMPVATVVGELDRKYDGIAVEMCARIGSNALWRGVSGAGHAVHLQYPKTVAIMLRNFPQRVDP